MSCFLAPRASINLGLLSLSYQIPLAQGWGGVCRSFGYYKLMLHRFGLVSGGQQAISIDPVCPHLNRSLEGQAELTAGFAPPFCVVFRAVLTTTASFVWGNWSSLELHFWSVSTIQI